MRVDHKPGRSHSRYWSAVSQASARSRRTGIRKRPARYRQNQRRRRRPATSHAETRPHYLQMALEFAESSDKPSARDAARHMGAITPAFLDRPGTGVNMLATTANRLLRQQIPRPPAPRRAVRGIAARCCVGIGALLLGLALTEAIIGWAHPVKYLAPLSPATHNPWTGTLHQSSSIPGLVYELAPSKRSFARGAMVETNAYGMRDREPLPEDTAGLYRIVVLGDSFTFGQGVGENEAYPNVLESLLNQAPEPTQRAYDVLNLGVSGYTTQDESLLLEHRGMKWSPRLVIIGYVLNDPDTTQYQPLERYFLTPPWWQHSHLLRAAAQAKVHWDVQTLAKGDRVNYLHVPGHEHWRSVTDAFRRIEEQTAQRGTTVLLVVFPFIVNDWKEYPYHHIHEQVLAEGRSHGFVGLDLFDAFSRHEPLSLALSDSDRHPNELAHLLTATAIRDKLAEGVLNPYYVYEQSHDSETSSNSAIKLSM